MDRSALVTYVAGKVVTRWDLEADGGATMGTEIHGRQMDLDIPVILIQCSSGLRAACAQEVAAGSWLN